MNKNLLLITFGISGMTALIYEIIWIRPLSLVFGVTIFAVSTIVASFILGLAIGSWLAGRYADNLKNPLKYFSFTQLGIGFYGILLLPVFSILPFVYLNLYQITYPIQTVFILLQILMSMGLITIPAILMGTTLPLMMKTYSKEPSFIAKDVGKLDASNSLGAFFGTLTAGFLLIPIIGIHDSIMVTASINIGLALIILFLKKYLSKKYLGIIVILLVSMGIVYPSYDVELLAGSIFVNKTPNLPFESFKNQLYSQEILFYDESLYQNVMVADIHSDRVLRLDGKIQCSDNELTKEGLVRLASQPYSLFVNNYGPPQKALNIGLGCGTTSFALSKNVTTTTVEIDSSVVKASEFFYEKIDHNLMIDDGRNWLLKNEEKFDLIITEPSEPWQGNGFHYTQEYFQLMSNSLSENGLVTQWIPAWELVGKDMMIMYDTFHSVFPYVYVFEMEPDNASQLIFIGSNNKLKIPETDHYLFNQDDIESTNNILNTDDKPVLEFSTAYNLYNPPGDRTVYFDFKDPSILEN